MATAAMAKRRTKTCRRPRRRPRPRCIDVPYFQFQPATGEWSKKAIKEAKGFCDVHIAASSEDKNFTYAPKNWNVRKDAAYVHYCSNETIGGVEFHSVPAAPVPIVADASSHFLSRPIEV